MKNKNSLSFLMISGLLIAACGCFTSCGVNYKLTKKTVPFINKSPSSFTIPRKEIDFYYVNESDVPYVDVLSFLTQLDGLFDGDNIYYYYHYDYLTISINQRSQIHFNWRINQISTGSFSYFSSYTKSISGINYSSYLQASYSFTYGGQSFLVDLDDYGFDIIGQDHKCLIPFFFANTLFCSPSYYNIIFNGDACYGVYGESSVIDDYYDCSNNRKAISSSMREATLNSLYFVFDYLYGLKTDKGYSSFKDYVPNAINSNLSSNDAEINYAGYKELIYGFLDELHTRIDFPSYYANPDIHHISLSECGEFYQQFYNTRNTQVTLRDDTFGGLVPVRYSNNVAIITFDSFKTGSYEQIYDSNGNIKEDAWQYDTYFFMRHCMNEIQNHVGIEEILIDLSLNGGGNMGALFRTLGFITDENIHYSTLNYLTNYYSIIDYQVDTDGDGTYPNDAYTQYRWNLLTSINTFSAANAMASIFKEMNLGTIFGQKSGGGMCTVLPLVLADGTGIAISSTSTIRYVQEENGQKVFYPVEHGIEPNVEVEYSDFYNDTKLVEYLNNY